MQLSLDLQALAQAYADSSLTPLDLVDELLRRFSRTDHAGILIGEPCAELARAAARDAMARRAAGQALPLFGIPFAVKDNIDVMGLPTTAACPAFAHRAERHAAAVERLLAAGALPIAKTNLDQFATGLVGVRSPYGIPRNPFDERLICGGSSSGSATIVARGLASFSLGTDTAGSGRVPAAFSNLVGLKPTRGMLSTRGVVPACRSLDCVSVFALCVDDAAEVAAVLAGHDAQDPYSRPEADTWDPRPGLAPPVLRIAVPRVSQLEIDDAEYRALFAHALVASERCFGVARETDLEPFIRAGGLLYGGPWVAERLEATASLLARDPEAVHPAVRAILEGASDYSAADAFRALHELRALRGRVDALFRDVDLLLLPTVPAIYSVEQVLANPHGPNLRLGLYTSFVNLLDLCALAIPAGSRADGVPFGITLIARRGRDALLASVGRALHPLLSSTAGATSLPLPMPRKPSLSADGRPLLAVVGAHLSGEPLNHELTDLGARLVCATRTAPRYRLHALALTPPKPGLVRVGGDEPGHAIEVEVWQLDQEALGRFMRGVRAPLCIGTLELEDGSEVLGFLCEASATRGQRDISSFAGWRAFRRHSSSSA